METGDEGPTVCILLLGDSGVGKTTFLSRLRLGPHASPDKSIPLLPAHAQPYVFNLSLPHHPKQREQRPPPYRLEFYDTSYPENFMTLAPDFIIMSFDIGDRSSLENVRKDWWRKFVMGGGSELGPGDGRSGDDGIKTGAGTETVTGTGTGTGNEHGHEFEGFFHRGEGGKGEVPIMLLGLKRDIRGKKGREWIEPGEALQTAQQLRLDLYAECSAVSGELMREVFEDIARRAVMCVSSSDQSGKGDGAGARDWWW